MSDRIWITWESQRRNYALSRAFNAELFQFDLRTNRLYRYLKSLFLTFTTFIRERPDLIFVQNPSLILALFAVNYGRATSTPVVVDAHNAGVLPFDGNKWWGNKITHYIFRYAALTIVTNKALSDFIMERGGKTAILPDPIPVFHPDISPMLLKGRANVLFICTFAGDEPYMELIEAGRLLSKDIFIYVTGRYKGDISELVGKLPENVLLTGFIPEDDFVRMLHSVDIVIDLTTREDCLVCGAYEAVAAERVLIVSATKALREYFHKGTVYTLNNSTDIAKQIEYALQNKERLIQEVKKFKNEKTKEWASQKAELENKLKVLSQHYKVQGKHC